MTEKQMRVLSVVATLTAVGMYVSYIPQIQNNLAGNPGSPLQPPRRRLQLHIMGYLRLSERKTRLPRRTGKRPRHHFGLDYLYHQLLRKFSDGLCKIKT